MPKPFASFILILVATISTFIATSSCEDGVSAGGGTTSTPTPTPSGSSRTVDAYTTSGAIHGNCALKTRSTATCDAARTALGFTGNWLKFSCNITLGLLDVTNATASSYAAATWVTLTFVDLPEHESNYYPTSGTYSFTANGETVTGNYNDMYRAYTPASPNPSFVAQKSYVMKVPKTPNTTSTATTGFGAVGLTLDGIAVFDSAAANSDNIFSEANTFDECQGHPNSQGYHYHTEPWSISYDDNNLIGLMLDGHWIYGRR